jgi:hypothetical protein
MEGLLVNKELEKKWKVTPWTNGHADQAFGWSDSVKPEEIDQHVQSGGNDLNSGSLEWEARVLASGR